MKDEDELRELLGPRHKGKNLSYLESVHNHKIDLVEKIIRERNRYRESADTWKAQAKHNLERWRAAEDFRSRLAGEDT